MKSTSTNPAENFGRRPATSVKLAQLKDGQLALMFAKLAKKAPAKDKNGDPYYRCEFKDETGTRTAMIWSRSPLLSEIETCETGVVYCIHGKGEETKFGAQIALDSIRLATENDRAQGYDIANFVEQSRFTPAELFASVNTIIEQSVTDPFIKKLVTTMIEENKPLLEVMPAAHSIHHAYQTGLLEHIRSMVRVAAWVADHYTLYYSDLDPPINKSLLVAAAVLHDIGKLSELERKNLDFDYSTEGTLVGHISIGRDMVREAASKIPGFPRETLLQLEHAILAHHGKKDFGSPVVPQTLEALMLHYIDDLDSKVNTVVKQIMARTNKDDPFTDKVSTLEGRKFYVGKPQSGGAKPTG